jgi:glycosyltransferase involved in cell wall biosynthesis
MDGWVASNPRFVKIACPHKEFTFDEQIGLKRQLDGLGADLVHFAMVQQPIWYRGRVVTTMHDLTTMRFRNPTKNTLIFAVKQQVYKWVVKKAARKSEAIITPTQFVKDDVVHYTKVDPNKVTVTHEAADVFEDPPDPMPAFLDKSYIMFNGRPQPHKNLRRLIEAFAKLHQKYPNLYLMIAGKEDASYQSYVDLAKELGVSKHVILTGWITDGQLKWAMQRAKAYIYPGLSEGFGLPPLEAMLYGAPVVTSNNTSMPEVLGKAAHYFDPFSVDSMTQAIDEVLTDNELRQKLIAAGKKQVAKYSWKRMAEQTLGVYESVLK